jgi:hypothetical protein
MSKKFTAQDIKDYAEAEKANVAAFFAAEDAAYISKIIDEFEHLKEKENAN